MIRIITILVAIALVAGGLAYWLLSASTAPDAPPISPIQVQGTQSDAISGEARKVARPAISTPGPAIPPRATAAPDPVPPEPPREFAIRVVRQDGRPIADARVALWPDNKGGPLKTDSAGVVRVTARPGADVRLTVIPKEAPEAFLTARLDGDAPSVAIPDGIEIAGQLTVNGAVPKEPVPLTLRHESDQLLASTDAQGHFEFFNLRRKSKGWIEFPEYYRLESESIDSSQTKAPEPHFAFDTPATNLYIKLVERPAIRGRIVADSKPPVPIRGSVAATVETGTPASPRWHHARDDGWFTILLPAEFSVAALDVSHMGGTAKRHFEVRGPLTGVKHLGDIALPPLRTIALVIRDSAGQPIQGARAVTAESGATWSDPADADGCTKIVVDAGPCKLRVGRRGYSVRTIDVPDGATGPVQVALPPGNELTIGISLGDGPGKTRGVVRVKLSATGLIFEGPRNTQDPLLIEPGANDATQEMHQRVGSAIVSAEAIFVPQDGKPIIACGFKPGVQVTVQLIGENSDQVLDEQQVTIGVAESRALTLRSGAGPRDFSGVVVTEGGEPIPGASISTKGSRAVKKTTDAAGAFTISSVFGETVDVEIEKEGFPRRRFEAVRILAPGTPARLVLPK